MNDIETKIREIVAKTDSIFIFAAAHGQEWRGGDIAKELAELFRLEVRGILDEISNENIPDPCEPDCDEVRHALHQGGWNHHLEIESKVDEIRNRNLGEEKERGNGTN